jgi:hypothetical protein
MPFKGILQICQTLREMARQMDWCGFGAIGLLNIQALHHSSFVLTPSFF